MLKSKFFNKHKIVNTIDEAMALYLQFFEAINSYKNHDNLIQIRYEDIHKNPERELQRIVEFCKIKNVDKKELSSAAKKNWHKKQTESSNDFRLGLPDSYKKELKKNDIFKIEKELKSCFKEYDYKRSYLSQLMP